MKKLAYLATLSIAFACPAFVGCGSGENTVVEAPPEETQDDGAMDGMTDEEYDAAMEADMEG